MKKFKLCMTVTAALFLAPAIAFSALRPVNPCIKNIGDHVNRGILELDNCNLNDRDIPALAEYIARIKSLHTVSLRHNNIGSEGAILLAQPFMAKNRIAHTINLDDNHIGPEGVAELVKMPGLYSFSINDNNIGTEGALYLAEQNTIVSLAVNNNHINAKGTAALVRMPKLSELKIAQNELDAEGIATLVANKNINELDVSYTNFGFEDLQAFLPRPKLWKLYVNGLHLGDEGAKAIAAARSIGGGGSESTALTALGMADNDLTDTGLAYLNHSTLGYIYYLNISQNPISDQGVIAYVKSINYFWSKYLTLIADETNLTDQAAWEIADLANRHNEAFTTLSVNFDHIGRFGLEALEKASIKHVYAKYNDGPGTSIH